MTLEQPYRVMVAISETDSVEDWVRLAIRLCPENCEILLRGLITIPRGESLSEGALKAQKLRDSFDNLTDVFPMIRNENRVRVDYDPFERILQEMANTPVDLLLARWHGPRTTTGGSETADILEHAPCDVCLLAGASWEVDGPVLLTLHGGPNMTLGLRLAKALTPTEQISLFHAMDGSQDIVQLTQLLGTEGGISRVVTVRSDMDLIDSITRESAGHKMIVMGARFYKSVGSASATGELVDLTFEQANNLPFALVRAWNREEMAFHVPRFQQKRDEPLSTRVDRWFAENTFNGDEFANLTALLNLKEKQGLTISVALPALNEEETVGNVIMTIKDALMDRVPLLDEMVLIDGGSTDRTFEISVDTGITVYHLKDILPEMGTHRGKGEALWKSLYVTKGDIVAWIDTDIKNIQPHFVYGIIGPLLRRPRIQYVKGFYHRPIMVGGQLQAYGGGRVTELVARPLLNLFYPELSGIVQPLAGEYAGRRSALERVPFFSGYGVETGLLLDLLDLFGLDAIAQTNLKERVHHNQPLGNLSRMSFAILQVFIDRLQNRYGVQLLDHANRSMKTIIQTPELLALDVNEIGDTERPPMIEVPAYKERFHPHNIAAHPPSTATTS